MKRLVKLDPKTHRYTEIDTVKAKKQALELLHHINETVSKTNDEYEIWKHVVPLCENVLTDNIPLPIPAEDRPLKYQIREGLLTRRFEEKYAPFALTITGTPRELTEEIDINGECYTYVEFEDQ
jgi:hypothetical protein